MATDWLGKVRGHVSEASSRFSSDAKQRARAEKSKDSTVLTDKMLRSGQWDTGKVLHTTLNGGLTQITASELAAFRRNMLLAKQQAGFNGKGITARQVIDLASASPLKYVGSNQAAGSDIDKARREITHGVPVSALHETVRFITNAGGSTPGVTRHHVVVEMLGFRDAVDSLIAAGDDTSALRKAADGMRKGGLKFDCSCDRHRYFLRYVATIGGFNAGRDETGFPKIRNPGLAGVACKHVLRVMTELESSNAVLRFLERHLASASAYRANTTLKQAEAEGVAQAKKAPTRIKTSEQRDLEALRAREKREALRAREKREADKASEIAKAERPHKVSPGTRRLTKNAATILGNFFGLTPEQVHTILAEQANKGAQR